MKPYDNDSLIKKLYQITNNYHLGFEAQVKDILLMGLKRFNLDIGILSRIDEKENLYIVENCVTPEEVDLKPNDKFEFGQTYCNIAYKANRPISIEYMKFHDLYAHHPAYNSFKLESYIGMPVIVDNKRYGTLNFSSANPYPRKFKDKDIQALQLMASWVGTEIIRRQQEKMIQNYNIKLQRSNQELESFAYIVSHDLKEPLRGIQNYSNFLLEDYSDKLDNSGKGQLRTLIKLSNRISHMISDLLEFSKTGRTELSYQNCNLQCIINARITLLKNFLSQNNATVTFKQKLPEIYCDEIRVAEIFQNLITNGVKYNDQENKTILIDYEDNKTEFIFMIKDNGIGIKASQFENIFKIFKRLHGKEEYGGGTGVGMSIVKKIIDKHHGRIWMDSVIDRGTVFYFTFPKKN